jgi:hypothetical protein
MAVRLSALRAGRPLFLVLIPFKVWADPRAIMRLKWLGQLKYPITSSGHKPATFRLVHSASTNFAITCPPLTLLVHMKISLASNLICFYIINYIENSLKNSTDGRTQLLLKDCILPPYTISLLCSWIYPSSCFSFKTHNVSETGFSLRLQVKPTQLDPLERASPYLRTPAPTTSYRLGLIE